MKKFLLYIFILLLPLIILLPVPLFFFYETGEIRSFDTYLRPLKHDQLIGIAYSGISREYKFHMVDTHKPEIIALGTSRSLEIESNIFNPAYSFYNAGVATQNIRDLYTFVHKLSYNPKLIVIDLNHFWFNSSRKPGPEATYDIPKLDVVNIFQSCFKFYGDVFIGKIVPQKLFANDNIGIAGRFKEDGFTRTGTYNYGFYKHFPSKNKDYNFTETLRRIKLHKGRFEACNQMDKRVIVYINNFVDECKRRKIKVLAFMPPFAPLIYDRMIKDGNYQYIGQIYKNIKEIFDNENQFIYDYTDVRKLVGANDEDFIDGFHAGVIVDNLIFKDISSRNPDVKKYFVNSEKIDSINKDYNNRNPKLHNFRRKS